MLGNKEIEWTFIRSFNIENSLPENYLNAEQGFFFFFIVTFYAAQFLPENETIS